MIKTQTHSQISIGLRIPLFCRMTFLFRDIFKFQTSVFVCLHACRNMNPETDYKLSKTIQFSALSAIAHIIPRWADGYNDAQEETTAA